MLIWDLKYVVIRRGVSSCHGLIESERADLGVTLLKGYVSLSGSLPTRGTLYLHLCWARRPGRCSASEEGMPERVCMCRKNLIHRERDRI